MMILIFQKTKGHLEGTFRGYAKTYKVEIIINKNLSDLLSVIKNNVKNLFDESLRK